MIGRIFLALWLALASIAAAIPSAQAQFTEQRVWGGTSGGSANAQTLTIANMPAYLTGVPIRFLPGASNTTAATLNINGIGAKNVYRPSPAGPVVLGGGEMYAGPPAQVVEVIYDGTQFVITSSVNSTAASQFQSPQGYLTPCKIAAPVTGCSAGILTPTGDVAGATILYYQPATGNQVPIYNGSQMVTFSFNETQMTLTLGSSNLANTIYDVCVYNNAGAPAIGTTVAWTTSTAGSGFRGTGAGTAEITRINGIWTNAVQATVRNGAFSTVVAANQCTVVASILIDGTNGQVSYSRTFGQNRRWAGFNFYNRLPIVLKQGDPSASWTIGGTGGFISLHADANNRAYAFTGLAEEPVTGQIIQVMNTGGGGGVPAFGIGLNVTNATSGTVGQASAIYGTVVAGYVLPPPLGLNVFNYIYAPGAGGISAVFGQEAGGTMTVSWRG